MFTTIVFSAFYVFVAVWFFTVLFMSAINCVRARKRTIDAINKYSKRQLLDLCKNNIRFKGYSRASKQGKDSLRLFVLARA